MAKTNYFQDMENRYQGDEDWLNAISPQDIQKSAVKRIFREMVNGGYDYEKCGKYFMDSRFLENLIIAANNKVEYYTLLNNSVGLYREGINKGQYQDYPNIGTYHIHIYNLLYIYSTIYSILLNVKYLLNIAPLMDVCPYCYSYRNDINNE